MPMVLQIALGVLVGVVAACIHLALAWSAARQTVAQGQRGVALVLMPVRVVIVAAMLAGLALVGPPAAVAGLLGFAVTQRALRQRWPAEEPK
jgi:hypothetical protein